MALPPPISRLQDLRDRAAGALTASQAIVWNGTAWTTALVPIAGVNGLQTALDAKAATAHNHDASAITTGTIDPARIPVLPSSVQIVSSGAIADLTAPQQAEIGDGSIVTTTDGRRWVYTGSGSKVLEASYIELADITPDWGVIANKPATFAPSAHTHTASQISDSSAAGRTFLTAADVAAQRTALGLATVATSGSASDLGSGTLPAARLPIAAAGTLGGIRIGSGLSIDGSGIVSAAGLSAGTVSGSGLRWNGSAWVEATNSLNDGTTTTMTQQSITSRALVVKGHVSATTADAPSFAVQNSAGSEMFSVRYDGGDAAIYLVGEMFAKKVGANWSFGTTRIPFFGAGIQFGDTATIKNGGGGGSPYFAVNCRTSGNLGPVVLGADASDATSANTDIIDVAKAMRFRAGVQLIQGLPNAAPTDADIRNNCMAVWLDNGTNTLTFRIRKNDGTYITKTL
jgi:hypothetical protein